MTINSTKEEQVTMGLMKSNSENLELKKKFIAHCTDVIVSFNKNEGVKIVSYKSESGIFEIVWNVLNPSEQIRITSSTELKCKFELLENGLVNKTLFLDDVIDVSFNDTVLKEGGLR